MLHIVTGCRSAHTPCINPQIGLLVGRSGKSGRDTMLLWLPTPHVSAYILVTYIQAFCCKHKHPSLVLEMHRVTQFQ